MHIFIYKQISLYIYIHVCMYVCNIRNRVCFLHMARRQTNTCNQIFLERKRHRQMDRPESKRAPRAKSHLVPSAKSNVPCAGEDCCWYTHTMKSRSSYARNFATQTHKPKTPTKACVFPRSRREQASGTVRT